MCMLCYENSVKVCEVWICNKAICATFWNGGSIQQLQTFTWKFYVSEEWLFSQMPWQNCHRRMHIWRLFGRSSWNFLLWMFARHMHMTCTTSLSRTHAPSRVTTLPSLLAPTIDVTHICALHTLPSELLKNKRRHTLFLETQTSHTYTSYSRWRTHEEKRCTHELVLSDPHAGTCMNAFVYKEASQVTIWLV